MLCVLIGVGWLPGLSHQASAITLTISTQGYGPATYFPGTIQESHVDFLGNTADFFGFPTTVDLTAGVPLTMVTHKTSVKLGTNDGQLQGPDETQLFATIFSVNGTQTAVIQSLTIRQIANDQFQAEYSGSDVRALELPGLGDLYIEALSSSFQSSSGQGGTTLNRSRLTFSPIPEPSPTVLAMIGVTCLAIPWSLRQWQALRRQP